MSYQALKHSRILVDTIQVHECLSSTCFCRCVCIVPVHACLSGHRDTNSHKQTLALLVLAGQCAYCCVSASVLVAVTRSVNLLGRGRMGRIGAARCVAAVLLTRSASHIGATLSHWSLVTGHVGGNGA